MPTSPHAATPAKGLSVVSSANAKELALEINFEREDQSNPQESTMDRVSLTLETAEWLLEELHAAVDSCRAVRDLPEDLPKP